jgi:orotate phosphoribosyltransferase
VAGSFCIGSLSADRAVVLVDDVVTTGSTLADCVRAADSGGVPVLTSLTICVRDGGTDPGREAPDVGIAHCRSFQKMGIFGLGDDV